MKGRVWRFGSNIDTDQIIPAEYLVTGDPKELSKHVFAKLRPEFSTDVGLGDIIVAGKNFGCGSSREHAPRALIGAGVSCVIAESFARIFYRNSINLCLPPIECAIDTKDGDLLEVDFMAGTIMNTTDGKIYSFMPFPPFVLKIMEIGGLMRYVEASCTG